MCKASRQPNQSYWPGLTLQGYFLGAMTSRSCFLLVKVLAAAAVQCFHAGITSWLDSICAVNVKSALSDCSGSRRDVQRDRKDGFLLPQQAHSQIWDRQTHQIKFDSGCASCPLSLFHPHSHLYNRLPFHRSSLFNHLLFILPLWHAMYTHMCRAHTPHQTHTPPAQLIFILPIWHAMYTHTLADTHTCTCKHTHTCAYTPHQHNSCHPNPHNICLSHLESCFYYTSICYCLIFMFSKCHRSKTGIYISSTLHCFTPLVNILFMLSLLTSVLLLCLSSGSTNQRSPVGVKPKITLDPYTRLKSDKLDLVSPPTNSWNTPSGSLFEIEEPPQSANPETLSLTGSPTIFRDLTYSRWISSTPWGFLLLSFLISDVWPIFWVPQPLYESCVSGIEEILEVSAISLPQDLVKSWWWELLTESSTRCSQQNLAIYSMWVCQVFPASSPAIGLKRSNDYHLGVKLTAQPLFWPKCPRRMSKVEMTRPSGLGCSDATRTNGHPCA